VTSDMKRPMGAIVPLNNVEIAVRAGGVKSARCLRSGSKLRINRAQGRVGFRVPMIQDYEIVVLA